MTSNLHIALGQDLPRTELNRIGRGSYYHFILTVFEFLGSTRRDICADMDFEGLEHIRTALAGGAGCYILVAHLGNWEAMGTSVTRLITPSHIAVKTVGSPGVNRFVAERRAQNGLLVLDRGSAGAAVRQIFDILKRGEIVGFILDQRRPREPFVPFFGRPAKTNTSLAAIWQRRPSPVIPGFITRVGPGKHIVRYFPALTLKRTGDADADILSHTAQFNQALETMIRRAPEQYLWQHNRWKP